jgi:hypothetical protein
MQEPVLFLTGKSRRLRKVSPLKGCIYHVKNCPFKQFTFNIKNEPEKFMVLINITDWKYFNSLLMRLVILYVVNKEMMK